MRGVPGGPDGPARLYSTDDQALEPSLASTPVRLVISFRFPIGAGVRWRRQFAIRPRYDAGRFLHHIGKRLWHGKQTAACGVSVQ
jgi:hypothetical protein